MPFRQAAANKSLSSPSLTLVVNAELSYHRRSHSSTILGRAIKSEYLALGTLLGTVGISYASTSGGSKQAASKQTLQEVKDSVKIESSSREEEELVESIKKFIAEAEKGSKH
ncbi:hypothetical protein BC827DRAFT_1263913 [Russula dissimulans]|nr:hypothetical protein BC827DRAFT_1263913 [Russula dissimulans]